MSVALVATETGLRLAYGHLGFAAALTVLILAPEAYLPLRAASAQFHAAADGLTAAEKVFAFLDEEPPAIPAPGRDAAEPAALTVEHLAVHREGRAEPAPAGLSLTLAPGRITAVAGPSGCGKSTLISVLLGFTIPSAGRVSRTVRDQAGWLPQDPVLFSGTVAANIALGWPDAPPAVIAAAARAAAIDDVPLDRVLGARGTGLSAGQRRRVALARALLPDRPVLLLDEPTAGVDPAREAIIIATLRRQALAGKAVLVVSHRQAVLDAADEITRADRTLVH
jgi:ABC-type transport system involved in cytochrome bd biosynthesis fused ATPase/permease subunit